MPGKVNDLPDALSRLTAPNQHDGFSGEPHLPECIRRVPVATAAPSVSEFPRLIRLHVVLRRVTWLIVIQYSICRCTGDRSRHSQKRRVDRGGPRAPVSNLRDTGPNSALARPICPHRTPPTLCGHD